MTDRLLTDSQTLAAQIDGSAEVAGYGTGAAEHRRAETKAILAAQDAQSVDVDRKNAAHWLTKQCHAHDHAIYTERWQCELCCRSFRQALRLGKATWETPNMPRHERMLPLATSAATRAKTYVPRPLHNLVKGRPFRIKLYLGRRR